MKFNFIKCKTLFYSTDMANHEVDMETFNLDMNKISDINYFISHDVIAYLFKVLYMESKRIYVHDGSDPTPYLGNKLGFSSYFFILLYFI